MNGYERITAALRGESVDKVPIMLHNFMMAAEELNISMGKYRESPQLIADSFKASVQKYGLDGILVDLDTSTLSGSVGVKIDFPADAPARSHLGMLETLDELSTLKPVKIENYKYVQIWLEAVRILRDYFGNDVFIRGNCDQAPFSLASMIRGTQPWMMDLFIAEPSQVTSLLEYSTNVTCQFVRLMGEAGAHMTSNGDSPAGPEMISPEMYEQYALPYEKIVVETAHTAGMSYTLHICGNTDLILDKMMLSGADAFEIDYKTPIDKAFELLHDKAAFMGNIDPSAVLALGTPEQVRQKTVELLDVFGKTNRFILNAGCAIPPTTPSINIRTMVETARNYK